MRQTIQRNAVKVEGLSDFDIFQIFDCGQSFRFDTCGRQRIGGIAFGKYVEFEQPEEGVLIIHGAGEEEYETVWRHFLALDSDYGEIKRDILAKFGPDSIMREAIRAGGGIRILAQDGWEALCSFIISQNNNIPRIKKIIAALSERYGIRIAEGRYSFPTAAALAEAGEKQLFEMRTGFRAKYIYDAACRVADGRLNLSLLFKMPYDAAAEYLKSVKGVGDKVAACALLYGFQKTEAFPIDVWIRRVLDKYYPGGLDIAALGRHAGIAQQYLFYYERYRQGASGSETA